MLSQCLAHTKGSVMLAIILFVIITFQQSIRGWEPGPRENRHGNH